MPSEGQIGEANTPSAYSPSASRPEGLNQDNDSDVDEGVNTTGAVGGNTTPPTQPSAMAGTTTPEQVIDPSTLSDDDFDAHIDTLTAADAIQAISQRRSVEEADQYANWRKATLTKQRDKAQKSLNAKVKPFDPSRYPDYAQMKREERKYNEALQASRTEARNTIERITDEIATIDRYLIDRNRQIAAEREAQEPLRNGIAEAVGKLPINTLEQYIAREIALGTRIRMSDTTGNGLASELGITPGSQEHRELLSILSNADGLTPEQWAEYITENIEPEYRHLIAGRDTQDIRNAIIDTIHSGVTSRRRAYDYIAREADKQQSDEQRYYEAQELQAEIDADTEAAIREYEELLLSSLTPDDLAALDQMAGDYYDELLAIQQTNNTQPSAKTGNIPNTQTNDTNTTSTAPRNTQQGAASRSIQPSQSASNTTPLATDSRPDDSSRPRQAQPTNPRSTRQDVVRQEYDKVSEELFKFSYYYLTNKLGYNFQSGEDFYYWATKKNNKQLAKWLQENAGLDTKQTLDVIQLLRKYSELRKQLSSNPSTTRQDVVEPKSIGIGQFGPIYTQFKGKPQEAIAFLSQLQNGEAIAALNHPEIGDISLVWGNPKAGLEKIASKHPEVLDNLQGIINEMKVVSTSNNRIKLESNTHFAVVSREYLGQPRKQWLLTAFEKKNSAFDNTMDTGETSLRGKQNDTATLQNTVSNDKDTTNSQTSNNLQQKIAQAEAEVNTNPTEAQKEAGNYKKGHIRLGAFDITIEQPQGSIRRGVDANGKAWESKMPTRIDYMYTRYF